MAVFITIEDDPFALAMDAVASDDLDPSGRYVTAGRQDYSHVRRPLRGIQIKDDTYASIQVFTADFRRIGLYDSGGVNDDTGGSLASQPIISNFLIQQIQRVQEEKFNLVETFGEDYGFFFGQKPIMMRFSGQLINTEDFNWKAEWWANYEEFLRGTKLVERGARIYLTYDTVVLEGYLLRSSTTESSQRPYEAPFTFTMWVTRHSDTSAVGSTEYPTSEYGLDPLSFDFASPSPLMKMRSINAAVFTARSVIDAIRWGVTNVMGPMGAAQALAESAKQFAFGGTQTVPLGAVGSHNMVAANPGNYYATGSVPPGFAVTAGFGQITIRGPDTAPGWGGPAAGFERGKIRENVDEYPARTVGLTRDMQRNAFRPDPLAELKKAKDLLDATIATSINFAKFGVNIAAFPLDFVVKQTTDMAAMAASGGANMLKTEADIAQGLGQDVPDTTVVTRQAGKAEVLAQGSQSAMGSILNNPPAPGG